jgi:geranylgeranyl reductase family protein
MDSCDVLIVGGGPAGSTCAWRLVQAGMDVMVLDKKTFPRDKVCAGWITPAVVKSLQLDVEDYRRGRVFQPIQRFCTGSVGGGEVEVGYDAPVSFGIRRYEFDHYLLQRAGARLRLGEPFKSLERVGDHWLVNGNLQARLIVGAGGHFCPVVRQLGANLGGAEDVVAAQEIEFELSPRQLAECQIAGDRPELYFCADLKGYGWCFRKGNYLNVGLGRQDNHKLAQHVEAFCDWLKGQGKIPADTPAKFHGHAYLLYPHAPRPLLADHALVIGDAAGLAYPQSGEGIRPAVESALIAAETILAAQGDYRAARLAPYAAGLSARFGQRAEGEVRASAPGPLKQFLAGKLLATGWFSRHVVLDRWFLHRQQAPLVSIPSP